MTGWTFRVPPWLLVLVEVVVAAVAVLLVFRFAVGDRWGTAATWAGTLGVGLGLLDGLGSVWENSRIVRSVGQAAGRGGPCRDWPADARRRPPPTTGPSPTATCGPGWSARAASA